MKRNIVLLLVVLVLSACNYFPNAGASAGDGTPAPAASPTDSWKSFAHAAGRFSVSVPTPMKESLETANTLAGKLETHVFTATESGATIVYMVGYNDFPADLLKGGDPQKMLQSSVEGVAKNLNGKITSQVAGVQDGMQGREFRAEIPAGGKIPGGGVMRGRVFIVQNRLYQLYVISTKEMEKSPQTDKFINSFKFTVPK